jgi:hypothetical protein
MVRCTTGQISTSIGDLKSIRKSLGALVFLALRSAFNFSYFCIPPSIVVGLGLHNNRLVRSIPEEVGGLERAGKLERGAYYRVG